MIYILTDKVEYVPYICFNEVSGDVKRSVIYSTPDI